MRWVPADIFQTRPHPLVFLILVWYLCRRPVTVYNFVTAASYVLTYWVIARIIVYHTFARSRVVAVVANVLMMRVNSAVAAGHNGSMLLTLLSICWLLYRAWQTVNTPVPRLVGLLRIDIPETPELVLYEIRPDAASVYWSKPPGNRPVDRFRVQVNGVIVGETATNDTTITISGLRPNHFYNVRVIAVGPSNYQTASRVMRMRTFAEDWTPDLGNGRVPPSLTLRREVTAQVGQRDDHDARNPGASIVLATLHRSTPAAVAAPILLQRRNTLNRKQSSSVTGSGDPPRPPKDQPRDPFAADGGELSYEQLNAKFNSVETDLREIAAAYEREEAEYLEQEKELKGEKERKKNVLREREEKSSRLKAQATNNRDRISSANKSLEKSKGQLHSAKSRHDRMNKTISDLGEDVENMRGKVGTFAAEKEGLEREKNSTVSRLVRDNSVFQDECARLEAELAEKGKSLIAAKQAGNAMLGKQEDARSKEQDAMARRDWDQRRKDLQSQVFNESRRGQQLESRHARALYEQTSARLQQKQRTGQDSLYTQANTSAPDLENNDPARFKRKGRIATSLSGISLAQAATRPPPPSSSSSEIPFHLGPPRCMTFGRNYPYLDPPPETETSPLPTHELSLRNLVAGSTPLSPSLKGLLPSDMLDDDGNDPDGTCATPASASASAAAAAAAAAAVASLEPGRHSPSSSTRSLRMIPSPHGSASSLAFHGPARDVLPPTSTPAAPPGLGAHGISSFFSLQRHKPANTTQGPGDLGPVAGTLRPVTRRSFPTEGEDDPAGHRRRTSISSHFFARSATGPDLGQSSSSPSSSHARAPSARRFMPFGSSGAGNPPSLYGDRDPSGPRPSSIASDIPRPSAEGGSIWGPVGGDVPGGIGRSRLWPQAEGPWSSGVQSRQASVGSASNLKTTLASPDDEILDSEALLDPQVSPSQVGVIGSRPHAQGKGRLNPAAPTFMGGLFKKSDRGKEAESESPGGAREKNRGGGSGDKAGGGGHATATLESHPRAVTGSSESTSPADSRKSLSTRTERSVSESCESPPSLDPPVPDTPFDPAVPPIGGKDPDNVVRKLFRKSSSGKFNGLSSRLGKKGPGAGITGTEKNGSAEARTSSDGLDHDHLPVPGEDVGVLGRSFDSVGSNPSAGSGRLGSRDGMPRENGGGGGSMWIGPWNLRKKKGRDAKDNLELDRAADADSTASPAATSATS